MGLSKKSPKRQIPLSNFYKIKGGGGCLRSVPLRQISQLLLLKCGLTAPQIAEIGNFWYKFEQKGVYRLKRFYEIWLGRHNISLLSITIYLKITQTSKTVHKFSIQTTVRQTQWLRDRLDGRVAATLRDRNGPP